MNRVLNGHGNGSEDHEIEPTEEGEKKKTKVIFSFTTSHTGATCLTN